MDRRTLLGPPAALPVAHAFGQSRWMPTKPIRIIVPFAPGSGSDSDSRFDADLMTRELGQPVLVENRPGGSGLVTIQAVRSAPADGHTIMLASNSPMTVNPVAMKNLPYEPLRDFRPVVGLYKGPVVFIVKADSPIRTVRDLVDAYRKDKTPVAVGNYSAGYQLVASWLGTVTGMEINHVLYKGGVQMMTDIVAGQLQVGCTDFGGAVPMIRDGRLRALAITADRRWPGFENIPIMKETYPDFETWVWASFFVRSETPDDITNKLVETMHKVMALPEARAYQAQKPGDLIKGGPEEMRQFGAGRAAALQAGRGGGGDPAAVGRVTRTRPGTPRPRCLLRAGHARLGHGEEPRLHLGMGLSAGESSGRKHRHALAAVGVAHRSVDDCANGGFTRNRRMPVSPNNRWGVPTENAGAANGRTWRSTAKVSTSDLNAVRATGPRRSRPTDARRNRHRQ
jgi:tripartite-type tricarboxylate transporter receptor subunit TctC